MGSTIEIEFVAGPRCGQTETLDHHPAAHQPPLSIALRAAPGREPGPTYCRRDDGPDRRTGRWLFDHVPG